MKVFYYYYKLPEKPLTSSYTLRDSNNDPLVLSKEWSDYFSYVIINSAFVQGPKYKSKDFSARGVCNHFSK